MHRFTLLQFVFTALLTVCSLIGCGAGDWGVTPGGVQDIDFARELVARGTVPPSSTITVEGLLSQHDLPTVGAPCEGLLCVRPAVAVAPDLVSGESAIWLQLGMTSALSARERPPLDLTVVVDRSSAMSIDMAQTNEAVLNLVGTLSPDDRVSILAFSDTVDEIHAHGPVTDFDALAADVRRIRAAGGFNLIGALEQAVAVQQDAGNDPTRLRRIVVLSCGFPQPDAFASVAERAAAERIGFTFVGILLGYSSPIGDLLGQTRGGNLDYGGTLEETEALFSESADALMSPLAYDLRFDLELNGYEVERAYGLPGEPDATGGTLLEVATAFPSSRRGAIMVRLRRTAADDQTIGTARLSYEPEVAWELGSEAIEAEAALALPEGDTEIRYGSDGVRKAVALVNMAEVLRSALENSDTESRRLQVEALLVHLRSEAEALDDDGLHTEVAFVEALAALL